jgi:ADP-ribose pyrophosphatase YjhB (NUDIX family)
MNIYEQPFKYCPQCKSEHINIHDKKLLLCRDCGFKFYLNTATAVVAIIKDKDDNLLVTVRAFEPRSGTYDLPGGFVDPGESAEDALRREIKEELGVTVSSSTYFCSSPNIYEYEKIKYNTVDIAYLCNVEDVTLAKAADDVGSILFINLKDIDLNKFGFQSIRNIVSKYLKEYG